MLKFALKNTRFTAFVQQTGEGWRVIMIEPAEALNIAAANALLKTLEEPGSALSLFYWLIII